MKIRKLIFNKLPLPIRVVVFMMFRMNKPCGYGEVYRITLRKAFDTFLPAEERNDKKLIKRLTRDIVLCWLKYQALPYEYFLFNFRNKSASERWAFETDMDRILTLCRVSDNSVFKEEINDKYNFFLLSKSFFKRDAIKIDSPEQENTFVLFVKRYGKVFIKPLDGSQGRGARVFSFVDEEKTVSVFNELLKEGDSWMVEECIRQSASMGQWNESSVNTIRIPSFLRNGQFTVIWTRMRMGKKGAIVDNAGSGGIVVNVDPLTGIISSDGIDESFNHFDKHPDSKITFKGWQVPQWKELLMKVEELHRTVFYKHVYVAWDFALTDDGWVVIEGNWGQLLGQQTASQVGVRKEFHELIGDYSWRRI